MVAALSFFIAGVRARAALAAKRQLRPDSAFNGSVSIRRAHGEVYGQAVEGRKTYFSLDTKPYQ